MRFPFACPVAIHRFRRPFWLVLGAVALSLSPLAAQGLPPKSSLLQEEGAVYLEGLVKKQIKGRLTEPAPCYSNLNGGRWLGNLLANQEVVLLAVSEKAFRVRGRAQQGNVAGWVRKDQVAGISQEMLDSLTKLHERQILVQELIEAHQVSLGMTSEEVVTSLGKPDKTNSKVTKEGRTETMEFITYERVPQTETVFDTFGRPFQRVVYVKVESGRVTINFDKGIVSSIEEKEGVEHPAQGIRIVPPPFFPF